MSPTGLIARTGCALLALVVLATPVVASAPPDPTGPTTVRADEPTLLIRVRLDDPDTQAPFLGRVFDDVPHYDSKDRTLDIIGGPDDLALLLDQGYDAWIERDLTPTDESITALSDYLDETESAQILADLESTYPAVAKRFPLGTTHEGRTQWALKISDNVDLEEDEHSILFVGQHHAREVMTPEIVTDLATLILEGYGSDPELTHFVDDYEIWVIASHNPDGTHAVFNGESGWRKNRRNNGDGNLGVDPNRNYPFQWGNSRCNGSDSFTSSGTYHGPSAASEPITVAMMDLARDERPVLNMSYHTYGELVIQSYGCTDQFPSAPDGRAVRDVASEMSTLLVRDAGDGWYVFGNAKQTVNYEVDGEMNDWFYAELGSLGVTVEANNSSRGHQPDYATWRDSIVDRNRPGWLYLLRRMDGPMVRGNVTDACTGLPLEAEVRVANQLFQYGELPRVAEPQFGRYAWVLSAGDYTLEYEEAGYGLQSWPLTVGTSPVEHPVRLVPAGERGVELAGLSVRNDDDQDGAADPGETVTLDVTAYATGGSVTGLQATLTTSDPYLTVVDGSASWADLPAGGQAANLTSDPFEVAVSPVAPDGHRATITVTFSSAAGLCAAGGDSGLPITFGHPGCPSLDEPLNADPGWAIDNGGATGGWEFGTPQGSGGAGGPAAAYTGDFVYATNLTGNYGDDADLRLTAGPFDLSGLRSAELRYARWLNTEAGYDLALVELSTNGVDWTEVHRTFGRDLGWELYRHDISALADLEDEVYVRFRVVSDSGTTRSGFYLDDLSFCGEEVPSALGKLRYDTHLLDDSPADYGNGDGESDTGETLTLQVTLRSNRALPAGDVWAELRSFDPSVTVRNGYAEFPDIGPGGIGTSLAPHFTFTVDTGCRQNIPFELETHWDGSQSWVSAFSVPVGTLEEVTLLDDDFETDQGWTTGSEGGATAGFWVREDPYGVFSPFGDVQPEDDTTPDPGVNAWITENPRPKGNFGPEDGDVDGGAVDLYSPVFDGDEAESLQVSFNRWFHRSAADQFDTSTWTVEGSSNGGASFDPVEELTGDASAWTTAFLELVGIIATSDQMQLRFRVEENLGVTSETILEGLVDDVVITRQRRECEVFSPPVRLAPNPVGNSVLAAKDGGRLRLEWTPPVPDPGHDPATSYRVYQSPDPDGGFGEAARPTSPAWVDPAGAIPGAGAFYLVASENSGGLSGEQP